MEIFSVKPAYALITEPGEPCFHQNGVIINQRWFLGVACPIPLINASFRVCTQSLLGDCIHEAFFTLSWICSPLYRDLVELSEAADGRILETNGINLQELSSFFILSLNKRCDSVKKIRRDLETVEDLCPFPVQGSQLLAAHTPTVDSRLLSLVTEAIVSRTFRPDSSVFVADCRTGRFSQGASLFRNDQYDERMNLVVGLVLFPASLDIGVESAYHFAVTFRSVVISGIWSIEAPIRAVNLRVNDFGAAGAAKRVVQVRRGLRFGSGVVIGKKHILTCSHILTDETADISIKVSGTVFRSVELKVNLKLADIALLKVNGAESLIEPVLTLESIPRLGDQVAAFGFPAIPNDGNAPTQANGVVSAITSQFSKDCHSIYTSCSIIDGFSGGGIFTRDGFFIALICRSTKTLWPVVNMAVGVSTVLYYLRENGYSDIPITQEVETSDSNHSVRPRL